jgi:hypothetical protein
MLLSPDYIPEFADVPGCRLGAEKEKMEGLIEDV